MLKLLSLQPGNVVVEADFAWGPYLNDVYTEGGGGLTKCRCSKGGCVYLVLWILPKCRQGGGGGPKSRKLCRRHLSMAPYHMHFFA